MTRGGARAARRPGARSRILILLAALACLAACAMLARANTEQFSTFDVVRPEEDDESLLDHVLTRPPWRWRDEWERAPLAIRTSQGCLTSGQWINQTQMKLRTPMGRQAQFGVSFIENESDLAFYSYMDLEFLFRAGPGFAGGAFRPYHDKSRQDFIVSYEAGHDTADYRMRLAFSFEDMFNELWAWRQTRVGDASAPYTRHPYEPAIELGVRRERWRARLGGQYLTPSIKHVQSFTAPIEEQTLWGTLGTASLEVDALGLEWEALGINQQARSSSDFIVDPANPPLTPVDSVLIARPELVKWRRLWAAEAAVARRFTPKWRAQLRYRYQGRTQDDGDGNQTFDAIDRLVTGEVEYLPMERLGIRLGGMFDRITVASSQPTPPFGHGTRNESRFYIGLDAVFGRIRVYGVEGVELDPEKYEVSFHHDKGFLGLQARF